MRITLRPHHPHVVAGKTPYSSHCLCHTLLRVCCSTAPRSASQHTAHKAKAHTPAHNGMQPRREGCGHSPARGPLSTAAIPETYATPSVMVSCGCVSLGGSSDQCAGHCARRWVAAMQERMPPVLSSGWHPAAQRCRSRPCRRELCMLCPSCRPGQRHCTRTWGTPHPRSTG